MKVRTGFVSNSSSSSFTLITTKENYDKMIQELIDEGDLNTKKVAEHMAEFPEDKFLGKDITIFTEYCDTGGEGTLSYMEDLDDPYESWGKIQGILGKNPGEVVTSEIDF
jgi:hypothetical protein